MPVDRERLYDALRKADAAGDTAAAQRLAAYIREQGSAAPEAPAETAGPGRTALLSAADSVPFAKQIGAGLRTAVQAASRAATLDPEQIDIVETYRQERDAITAGLEADQAANPTAATVGTVAGIGAQVISAAPATIGRAVLTPIVSGRALLGSGRALLSREGIEAAGRSLLTRDAAKTAGQGALISSAYSLSDTKADLTKGEFAEAAQDVVEDLPLGVSVALGARALLAGGSQRLGQRALSAADDAARAQAVQAFDDALAAYPDELAAVKAANAAEKQAAALDNAAAKEAAATQNAAARESASAQNAAAREAASAENARLRGQYRAETTAAKAEAKAATQAKQTAAQEAELQAARANPLRRTGLESKLQSQYGPKVAKERAQALVNEPMPGQPGKGLIDEAEKLSPEARFDYAQGLRMGEGAALGKVRDELAKVPGASVPVAPIKEALKTALGTLPAEVQAKGLKQIEGMIGKLAKDGSLSPAALRKLIEDTNALAKYGSPRLESALGRSQKRIFRSAYSELVNRERELIGRVLPEERAAQYTESLRKYAVYSDFEQSADVLLRRANKGLPAIRVARAAKVAPVAPREVAAPAKVKAAKVEPQLQEPTLREPMLKPEPTAPEFAGGDEALAAGRKLLQPPLAARVAVGAGRLLVADATARAGALVPLPGTAEIARRAGSRSVEAIGERFLRWVTATPGSLSARAAKLERLKPMMEEALQKGPAEVARVHALFMQRSPDYRKAIESEE